MFGARNCKYINLIIRPSVREFVGTASGKVGTGTRATDTGISLTEYPVLSTREAETQVLMESGRTIVIGGLIKDRKTSSTFKVPILGSIPIVGALFRRETEDNQKIELLIFLTATIRSPEESAPSPAEKIMEQRCSLTPAVVKRAADERAAQRTAAAAAQPPRK